MRRLLFVRGTLTLLEKGLHLFAHPFVEAREKE
jgi:hypothetical protein